MNRLKYVLGINVPRSVPSNAAILTERHFQDISKKHHSDARLLKSSRLTTVRTRKPNDFKSVQYARQQRNGTLCAQPRNRPKSGSVSLKKSPPEKNVPVECAPRRRKSGNKASKDARIWTNMAEVSTEKEPRSYAQIIASYDEAMSAQFGLGVLRDSLSSTMINRIHRSPFCTASVISVRKSKDKAAKHGNLHGVGSGMVSQEAKFSSEASLTNRDRQHQYRDIVQVMGGISEPERTSSSYATIIERYSNAINPVDSRGWNGNRVPRRNVSTKLDTAPVVFLSTKGISGTTTEVATSEMKDISDSLAEAGGNKAPDGGQRQAPRMTKVEDIMKDLKRITAKGEEADANSHEKWMLQSVNERAHWLDRVVSAHKKRIKEKRLVAGKTARENEITEIRDTELKNNTEELVSRSQVAQMASDGKPPNPIQDYIKRSPAKSNTPSKNTTQSPTTAVTGSKEPQIELNMTASKNDSVVSINMDDHAMRAGAKDQLSVVISSKKSNVAGAANPSPQTDFGSMQISISENTVPVKQIEFSINGKPVSELKSILARADKLDVVSSMDKIEIRIPSRNSANASKEQPKNVAATATPVLNLHIAAKFNEPRKQQPKDAGLKPSTTSTPTRPPPTHETPKPQNIFVPKTTKSQDTNVIKDATVTNVEKFEQVSRTVKADATPEFHPGAVPKEDRTPGVAQKSSPSTVKASDVTSESNQPPTNPPQDPSMNTEDPNPSRPAENRIPSGVIPWWSSEDAFKKIKKKGNAPKNTSQPQEGVAASQKTDQTLRSDVESVQPGRPIDSSKSETPRKNAEPKEPAVDEKKPMKFDDVRVVRVQSPPKWVAIKPVPVARSLRHTRQKIASSRHGKKVKNRARCDLVKASTTERQNSDTSIISATRLPKMIKYTPVKPRVINIDQKPETKKEKVKVDQQGAAVAKVEAEKVEQDPKRETKVETSVIQGNPEKKAKDSNAQDSKAIIKPTNRSADASVKLPSPVRGSRLEDQGKMDRTSEKDSFKSTDEVSGKRIDEILKTMKPIEKKKDGTLIDYGVTVPSRKPSKIRQSPRPRNKPPIKVDAQNVVVLSPKLKDTSNQPKHEEEKIFSSKKQTATESKSVVSLPKIVEQKKIPGRKDQRVTESKSALNQSKVVEPEKIISVKKQTLREPKSVVSEPKIVEPVKIVSTKKQTLTESKNVPSEPKIVEPVKITSTKKQVTGKNAPNEPKIVEPAKIIWTKIPKNAPSETKIVEPVKVISTKKLTEPKGAPNDQKIVEQAKIISTKKEALREPKNASSESKIVEPAKVISTKKLTEPKGAPNDQKIVEQAKIISTKKEALREPKNASSDTKIVQQAKIISTKKQIQTEPKNAANESKIVEPAKLTSTKKLTEPKNASNETKIVEPAKVISAKKLTDPEGARNEPENVLSKKEQINSKTVSDPPTVTYPTKVFSKKKQVATRPKSTPHHLKTVQSTKIDSTKEPSLGTKKLNEAESKTELRKVALENTSEKQNNPGPLDSNKLQINKLPTQATQLSPEPKNDNVTGKAPLQGTLGTESSKSTLKSNETSSASASKPLLSDRTIKVPFEGTVTPPQSRFSEKREAKSGSTLWKGPGKAPFVKGIVYNPRPADKEVSGIDMPPLARTSAYSPQKTSAKVTKNDNAPEESAARLEKRLNSTGVAPLEGTIRYQSSKDNVAPFTTVSKKKESTGKIAEDSSHPKEGGGSESSGPASPPTGPAGLTKPRSFVMAQEPSIDKVSVPVRCSSRESCGIIVEENKGIATSNQKPKQACAFFSSKAERPEKDILYSSWLQRFKNKLDDGKVA